jgi:hypothetical protein
VSNDIIFLMIYTHEHPFDEKDVSTLDGPEKIPLAFLVKRQSRISGLVPDVPELTDDFTLVWKYRHPKSGTVGIRNKDSHACQSSAAARVSR